MAVHDGLGFTGSAGREQNHKRVLKGYRNELHRCTVGGELGIGDSSCWNLTLSIEIGQNNSLHGRKCCTNTCELIGTSNRLCSPLVAIDGNNETGVELLNAIEHALWPHLGWN